MVTKLGAVNVVRRDNSLERGVNYFHRGGRKNVEVEVIARNAAIEDLTEQLDIFFQVDALSDLVEMLLANARMELRVVQQQVSQFGTLLDQVQFDHPLDFPLEFLRRNSDHLAENIAGVVERERLVEVARE